MEKINKNSFTTKLLAFWLNALFIFGVLKLFFYVCLILPVYLYFPFVFTYITTFSIYWIICIYFKRRTLGAYLLRINTKRPFTNVIKYLAAVSLIIAVLYYIGNVVCLWNDFKGMKLTSSVIHLSENRDVKLLKEISSLSDEDYSALSHWIADNKQAPEDYVVTIAKNHKITLIGEYHEAKNYLDFFNNIIPNLYYRAGVRCIAMECIPSSMNRKIEKLINSKEFNTNLFFEISRSQGWYIWGFEEYWDVLKTAWELNNNLKPEEQKLRVVGIDSDWEGPNLALVFSTGDDGIKNVSFMEKFRVFSLLSDLVKVGFRDEIMARNIEKEAIEKNDKCVVLVGFHHSFINYGQRVFDNHKKLIRTNNRMGVMLNQKFRNDIFQIVLHSNSYIPGNLDKLIFDKELDPIGFSVENSPFAMLCDSTKYLYTNQPTVSFSDVAQGYIYILSTNHKLN